MENIGSSKAHDGNVEYVIRKSCVGLEKRY